MRGPTLALLALLLLPGCSPRDAKEAGRAEVPTRAVAPEAPPGAAKPAPAPTPEAREANRKLEQVLAPSSPAADTSPQHFPGSVPVGEYAYQRTDGDRAVIDTWTRSTPAALDDVSAFYTERLGVHETSHLEDQRILTGSRLDGTQLAVTLRRQDNLTEITLVVSVPK